VLLLQQGTTTMKYILVSGGVMSGLGKGIVASSTGVILQGLLFFFWSFNVNKI
jgi:CTP synthase (UTP-ammonia lyase)